MGYVHSGDGAPLRGSITGDVTSVVVVGAGVAGLTAANALTGMGIPTIVLEARDRVGGRTHTVDFGSTPVDLGASWIHQPKENPLSDLARSLGVDHSPFEAFDDAKGWDPDSGELLDSEALQEILALVERVLDVACAGPRRGLKAAVDEAVALLDLPGVLLGRVRALARTAVEADASGPLEDLSTVGYPANTLEYEGTFLGDVPVGGYRKIVGALASGLDIRLDCAALTVSAEAGGVRVTCQDGSEETASHAIVTVPLGVLKSGTIAFEPALDAERQGAIDRLGFGRFDKLILRYERAYWRDVGVPHLVPTPSRSASPFQAAFGLDELTGQPVLMVFACGSTHALLAERDLDDATAAAHTVLRRALGKELPPPVESVRSEWWRDPWTRGAYTYLKDGATYDDLETLGTPHAGRVLFAGEATGAARTGYADGAILTGVREAKRLTGRDDVTIQLLPARNV